MKDNFLKIAIAIIVAISLVFIITVAIIALSVRIDDVLLLKNEGIGFTLLAILALAFFGLSTYVLLNLFGNNLKTKNVILTADTFSAITLNGKVLRQLIKKCIATTKGARLLKAKIIEDDKPGFKLALKINLAHCNVAQETQKIKYLLEDSLKREFNFSFNAITINVFAVKQQFFPDVKKAENYIKTKQAEEDCQNNCKLAPPTPKQEEVLKSTLTTDEIAELPRLKNTAEDASNEDAKEN